MEKNYVENLRLTINNLPSTTLNEFLGIGYWYQKNAANNKQLRKVDYKTQLHNFLNGNTTKISINNLNSYLYALDQLAVNGAEDAMFQMRYKQRTTWREVLMLVTKDVPLPKNVNPDHLDKTNLMILKNIMKQVLELSSNKSKEGTTYNLKLINDFISLKRDSE